MRCYLLALPLTPHLARRRAAAALLLQIQIEYDFGRLESELRRRASRGDADVTWTSSLRLNRDLAAEAHMPLWAKSAGWSPCPPVAPPLHKTRPAFEVQIRNTSSTPKGGPLDGSKKRWTCGDMSLSQARMKPMGLSCSISGPFRCPNFNRARKV